jgi:hypothetical protein
MIGFKLLDVGSRNILHDAFVAFKTFFTAQLCIKVQVYKVLFRKVDFRRHNRCGEKQTDDTDEHTSHILPPFVFVVFDYLLFIHSLYSLSYAVPTSI